MMTGVPVQRIAQTEGTRLLKMADELKGSVIGQDEAIFKVYEAKKRPLGMPISIAVCDFDMLATVARVEPCMHGFIETFLPGREFTVGIIGTGTDAFATEVMEVLLKPQAERDVYSYFNKENFKSLVEYHLVADDEARKAGETALAAWRGLGCRDAGRMDLRSDASGRPNFMEVNPLAGLHPLHSDLPIIFSLMGKTFSQLIELIMCSALKRLTSRTA
jgi:hypothetical protein